MLSRGDKGGSALLVLIISINIFNKALPPLSPRDNIIGYTEQCPSELLCTEDEVLELLLSIDTSKSSVPDGISGRMLKATAHSIASSVTTLFNKSIMSGKVPSGWKTSAVVPIPKGSDNTSVSNYRPISTSHLGCPPRVCLGPLLFLIYCANTPININSDVTLYADDFSLYCVVNTSEDYDRLQEDIDNLSSWVNSSLLNLNALKCKYMVLSRQRSCVQ